MDQQRAHSFGVPYASGTLKFHFPKIKTCYVILYNYYYLYTMSHNM